MSERLFSLSLPGRRFGTLLDLLSSPVNDDKDHHITTTIMYVQLTLIFPAWSPAMLSMTNGHAIYRVSEDAVSTIRLDCRHSRNGPHPTVPREWKLYASAGSKLSITNSSSSSSGCFGVYPICTADVRDRTAPADRQRPPGLPWWQRHESNFECSQIHHVRNVHQAPVVCLSRWAPVSG